jgi:retron-type reverse transcriptase
VLRTQGASEVVIKPGVGRHSSPLQPLVTWRLIATLFQKINSSALASAVRARRLILDMLVGAR